MVYCLFPCVQPDPIYIPVITGTILSSPSELPSVTLPVLQSIYSSSSWSTPSQQAGIVAPPPLPQVVVILPVKDQDPPSTKKKWIGVKE